MGGFARPQVQDRQLCAIARSVIEADPRCTDAEWRDDIKWRLASLGFAQPAAQAISAAMAGVEAALVRRWGPRP